MKAFVLSLALLAAGSAVPAFAQTVNLAVWNFENSTAGTGGAAGVFNTTGSSEVYNATSKTLSPASDGIYAASAFVDFSNLAGAMGGTANNNWGTFQGVTPGTATAAGGALSIIGTGNNTKWVDFTFSTLGYSGIHVSYDTRGTATGFTTQAWSDATAGTTNTWTSTLTGRNVASYSNLGFDIFGIDNLSSVTLRLAVTGATSTSGNNRFDNVTFMGVAIPEPSTYALLAGLVGFAVVLRRHLNRADRNAAI